MGGIMPVSKYHDSSDSIGLIFLMKFDLNDLNIQEYNVETRKRSWGFDSVESLESGDWSPGVSQCQCEDNHSADQVHHGGDLLDRTLVPSSK